MEIILLPDALDDLQYWERSGNKVIQNRIRKLLLAIRENPFEGIGKPEPLRHNLSGKWSRRISNEHRLIYAVQDKTINV